MKSPFQFAAASVTGRSHRNAGRNNQDAFCFLQEPFCTVAVVCDGCGSGACSEVGARLGARLVAQAILQGRDTADGPFAITCLETVRCEVLNRLASLAAGLGDNLTATITDYLLFTVVGVVLTPRCSVFFSLGDGVVAVNEEVMALGPFPGNAPPYLGYGLVESSLERVDPELLRFRILRTVPTDDLQSFLIGSDGVQDLMAMAGRNIPGKKETVGPLSRLWQDNRNFANPDMLRRHLAAVNRDAPAGGDGRRKEPGLLHDDTTIVVGSRVQGSRGGAAL